MKIALIALALFAGGLVAASASAADLYLDLRTNYSPATDFASVRVELVDRADPRQHWTSFALDTSRHDYVAGARVAELHEVQPRHSYLLVVRILDRQLRTVDGRVSILDMPDGPFAATVVLTRP